MREATIVKLARATGLNYCHPAYCGCGDYSYLLFTPVAPLHDDVSAWVDRNLNGCDPEEVYEWVQQEAWKNPVVMQAMRDAGLNVYRRYQPVRREEQPA